MLSWDMWGFVEVWSDLYSKVSVMSEDIRVCGVMGSVCHGISVWSDHGVRGVRVSWAGGPITFNKTKAVLPPPAVNILPPPHTSEMPSGGYTSVSGALQQLRGASGGGVSQCGRPKQFVRGGRRWGWVYGISLLWGVRGVGLGAMWEACTSSIPHTVPQWCCFMRGGLFSLV